MKAYKGFYKDSDGRLYCRKFYYKEGKTYETDKAELCKCGFHACTFPMDVFWYYNSKCGEVEFHEVELEDTIDFATVDDSIVCSTKITIGKEITPDEMFELSVKMIMADKEKYFIDDKPYIIRKDNKWNFIDTNGDTISDVWFDMAHDFCDGFASVYIGNKGWNFINTDGNIVSDLWFDNVWNFNEGFASVKLNDKWNFINTDGKLISEQWFNYGENFNNGFACVRINGRWHIINSKGEIIN